MFYMVHMVRIGRFKKFLEVFILLSCLVHEIMLSGHSMLLIGAICFLVVIVVAASNCDLLGAPLFPLLLPLAPFLAPLPVALDGAPQLLPGADFPLP
jgi:hypothetical protein